MAAAAAIAGHFVDIRTWHVNEGRVNEGRVNEGRVNEEVEA
jgi:hypothetical protein